MADIRMYVDAIHYAVERLELIELKSLQLKAALAIVTGRDVFGVLPTKNLCYACLPIFFDRLRKTQGAEPLIVIAVSPLTALMDLFV